jgi:hypothetical protein
VEQMGINFNLLAFQIINALFCIGTVVGAILVAILVWRRWSARTELRQLMEQQSEILETQRQLLDAVRALGPRIDASSEER